MKLKARNSVAKGFRLLREAYEQEDRELREAQEDTRTRAAKKRDEKALRQANAAARRAEVHRLVEKEEKNLEERKPRSNKKVVTVAQLLLRQKEAMEKQVEEMERRMKRVVTKEEYEAVVLAENTNHRDEDSVEANSIGEAIEKLAGLVTRRTRVSC